MLVGRLLLVETLQCTVVTLVEPPVFDDRNPELTHLGESKVERIDCTFQQGGMGDFETKPLFLHDSAGTLSLLDALCGQRDVGPTCENVLEIPSRLTVAE
jgi:hypothetical protein